MMQPQTDNRNQDISEELSNRARRFVNNSSVEQLANLKALTATESKIQSMSSGTAAEIIHPDLGSATIFCKGDDDLYAVRVVFHSENNDVHSFTIAQSKTLEELDSRINELAEDEELARLEELDKLGELARLEELASPTAIQ